ncbi:MAG: hypothetical protein QG673_1448 [Pseudomonadota bacterium]|nr:hypothetical protein [Pseudomonadota bacterium]
MNYLISPILEWLDTLANEYDFLLADERRLVSPGILYEMSKYGLFGLQIEKKFGGLELNYTDTAKIIEKLASINLTLATIVTTHSNGVYSIQHYGTEKLKSEYLPLLAKGQGLSAFALTEENAGSNIHAIEASATPVMNNHWIINGSKIWVDSGSWSSIIVTFCKSTTENYQQKFLAFAIPIKMPGVKIIDESYTMGLRSMVQNNINFNDVYVSQENLLGVGGDGLLIANATLDKSRLLLSIKALGASKRCLQLMINYAKNRLIATGRLLDNPVTLERINDISLGSLILELGCNTLISMLDTNVEVPSELLMMIKIFASELANNAAESALQILGGRGYMEHNLIAQIFRDARALKISEGTNESLNYHIGSVLIYNGENIYNFFEYKLSSEHKSNKLKELSKTIYDNCVAKNFDKNNLNEYWAYYLIGKASGYQFLNHIVDSSSDIDYEEKVILTQYLNYEIDTIVSQSCHLSKSSLLLSSTYKINSITDAQISSLNELNPALLRVETMLNNYLKPEIKQDKVLSTLHGNIEDY